MIYSGAFYKILFSNWEIFPSFAMIDFLFTKSFPLSYQTFIFWRKRRMAVSGSHIPVFKRQLRFCDSKTKHCINRSLYFCQEWPGTPFSILFLPPLLIQEGNLAVNLSRSCRQGSGWSGPRPNTFSFLLTYNLRY